MTPEEEKIQEQVREAQEQAQAAQAAPAQKVRLNNSSVTTHGDKVSETTHGDKVTTTTHDPKTTTRTERSVNGFVNPDGTPNEAAERYFQQQKKAYAQAYHVNPETGQVDRRFVSDILGVDPEVMRKQREEEMALNRRKQKESAWYNALAVLGDMVTTAMGGNVWKREADKHAKEAHDDNLNLQKEQAAEDIANNTKLRAPEKEYAAAVANLRDAVGKAYGTKISTSTEQGGDTKTTTTQGNDKTTTTQGRDVTTGHRDAVAGRTTTRSGSGSGSGGGSNTTKTVKIQVKNADGTISSEDFHIPANDFDAMGRYLSAAYNNLDSNDKDNVNKLLSANGIMPRDNGSGKNTYDGTDLLSSGIVFDDPQVRAEFIKVIQQDESRTPEAKQRIIDIMQQYPTEKERTKSWWQRFKEKMGWADNGGYNPEKQEEEEQNIAETEGGL